MKVLFVPVNYNSYDALETYIASVGKALEAVADLTIEVKIHVADNSTSQKADANNCPVSSVHYQLSHYPNPGYLPAALKTVYSEDYASYDYIIISNVDVTLDETFFTALRDLKPAPDTVFAALKTLGVGKEDAVYVGDSDVDIQTARNAGLPCISVLWGFRDRDFLINHGAQSLITHPSELLRLKISSHYL